jgi:hypothetical protein
VRQISNRVLRRSTYAIIKIKVSLKSFFLKTEYHPFLKSNDILALCFKQSLRRFFLYFDKLQLKGLGLAFGNKLHQTLPVPLA